VQLQSLYLTIPTVARFKSFGEPAKATCLPAGPRPTPGVVSHFIVDNGIAPPFVGPGQAPALQNRCGLLSRIKCDRTLGLLRL
jgi:hypothetical protein